MKPFTFYYTVGETVPRLWSEVHCWRLNLLALFIPLHLFSAASVGGPEKVKTVQICPSSPVVLDGSMTQAEVDFIFEEWKSQFSAHDDCGAQISFKINGEIIDLNSITPPNACGGAIEVVAEVESECGNQICMSKFIVESVDPAIIISLPIPDFTCLNMAAPPSYSLVPKKSLQVLLAFSIYSPCIDLANLVLEVEEPEPIISGKEYHFNRRYIISNDQGLHAIGIETFTLTYDAVPPILLGVPEDLVLVCGSPLPEWPDITASDGENILEVTSKEATHFTNCGGRYFTRTWTATDPCGNTTIQQQQIFFKDTSPPWIDVPADTIINCGSEIPPPMYEAGDNACSTFEVEFKEEKEEINDCDFNLIRSWQITDGCNLRTIKQQIIRVRDMDAPQITPLNKSLKGITTGSEINVFSCSTPRISLDDFEVLDNCCGVVSQEIISDLVANNACPIFPFARKWKCGVRAIDAAGNIGEFYFYVLQHDTTTPVIYNVPPSQSLSCGSLIPPIDTNVFAIDDCTTHLLSTFMEDTMLSSVHGEIQGITRTWNFTDHCGNLSEAVQNINICPENGHSWINTDSRPTQLQEVKNGQRTNEEFKQIRLINPEVAKGETGLEFSQDFIDISPNPAKALLNISTRYSRAAELKIHVLNHLGQVLKKTSEFMLPGDSSVLDISSIPSGSYILDIKIDGNHCNKIFIKNQ